MPKTRPEDLTWTPNPDGDYNAVVAEYKGHTIEVDSDRDADSWSYMIDGGEYRMDFESRKEAQREAIGEIDGD